MRQGRGKDAARSRRVCCRSAPSLPQANAKPTPSQTHPQNRHTIMRKQPHNNCRVSQVAAIVPQAAVLCSWGKVAARSVIETQHTTTHRDTHTPLFRFPCGKVGGGGGRLAFPSCSDAARRRPFGRIHAVGLLGCFWALFWALFLGSFLARKRFFLGSVARPKFRYGAFPTLSRFRWRKLPIFTKKCLKS